MFVQVEHFNNSESIILAEHLKHLYDFKNTMHILHYWYKYI